MPGREPHVQAERVGEDLPPERAAGEPAGRAHLVHLVAGGPHRVEHQRELQADPLDRGPDQVLAPVLPGQPDVRPERQAAPVRRPLAQQVRQHDQAAGAGRHPAGEVEQRLGRLVAEVGGQRSPGPVEHDAAVVDRAADHPPVLGQRVAEDAAVRVDRRPLDGHPQRAAGADRAGRDAGVHRAEAEVGQRPVAGTGDHRRGRRQPEPVGDLGRQPGQHGRGRHQLRQPLRPDAGQLQRLLVPGQRAEVEQAGAGGDRLVGDQRAAQPGQHVVLDAGPARDPGEQLRPLLAEPDQLGQRRHRVHRRAGPPVQRQAAGGRPQPVGLRGGPRVGPGQRRGQRVPGGVQPDQRVHRRAERQRRPPDRPLRTPPRGPCPAPRRGSAPGPARPSPGAARPAGSRPRRSPAGGRSVSKATTLVLVVPRSTPITTSSRSRHQHAGQAGGPAAGVRRPLRVNAGAGRSPDSTGR